MGRRARGVDEYGGVAPPSRGTTYRGVRGLTVVGGPRPREQDRYRRRSEGVPPARGRWRGSLLRLRALLPAGGPDRGARPPALPRVGEGWAPDRDSWGDHRLPSDQG